MFQLKSDFSPAGDQPRAIKSITEAFQRGDEHHVLLGVTGSGKTFTMAQVIQKLSIPALVIAPNKTLAAQLYLEFKNFFPEDKVGYFISYYDYFQPEAYIPSSDTYIAKDSSINEDIDKMRHETTRNLFEDKNTVIISSVSCIYGLGSPESYAKQVVSISKNESIPRNKFLKALISIQYSRNDTQLSRSCFRVRGDIVDILPSHQKDEALRVSFFGDEIERLQLIDAITGKSIKDIERISIYPGSHYVPEEKSIKHIIQNIQEDLGVRLRELKNSNKLVEAQRLEQRTMQDIEALEHLGFCPGIENYSRYLSGKLPGEAPPCLLDYFPNDFLTIIDESHITVPQIGGMYRGDRSRKQTLVDYGFRLPSALDNRPLNFDEFVARNKKTLYVSATPGDYEINKISGEISEQVIRPTGLLDPPIEIIPADNQVDHLLGRMRETIKENARVLITTLTKKMAEDLCQYYQELGLKVKYLHADIDTLARADILRDLRLKKFDILIGINLLREGLDLPEVQLVAVLDADKEGFLRSRRSLIQIAGRAARNHKANVIFYANRTTDSMQAAIDEMDRRRTKQKEYNEKNNIIPKTVIKQVPDNFRSVYGLWSPSESKDIENFSEKMKKWKVNSPASLEKKIKKLDKQMHRHAGKLEFEKAAHIRDEIKEMQAVLLMCD